MIAVMLNGVRIGSLLKFPHLKLPWCAYSHGNWKQSFKNRKEAVAWLTTRNDFLFAEAARNAAASVARVAEDFKIDPSIKHIPTRAQNAPLQPPQSSGGVSEDGRAIRLGTPNPGAVAEPSTEPTVRGGRRDRPNRGLDSPDRGHALPSQDRGARD